MNIKNSRYKFKINYYNHLTFPWEKKMGKWKYTKKLEKKTFTIIMIQQMNK